MDSRWQRRLVLGDDCECECVGCSRRFGQSNFHAIEGEAWETVEAAELAALEQPPLGPRTLDSHVDRLRMDPIPEIPYVILDPEFGDIPMIHPECAALEGDEGPRLCDCPACDQPAVRRTPGGCFCSRCGYKTKTRPAVTPSGECVQVVRRIWYCQCLCTGCVQWDPADNESGEDDDGNDGNVEGDDSEHDYDHNQRRMEVPLPLV